MLTSRRKAVSKALKARAYAATKAALNSFTRSWSKELGKHGIRVVGVAPGILENRAAYPEYEEALAWTRNITVEQLREGYRKNAIPVGRSGRLSEVADFVCYLLRARQLHYRSNH